MLSCWIRSHISPRSGSLVIVWDWAQSDTNSKEYPTSLTHLLWDKIAATLTDDIFIYIVVNEKFCILIKISLKFVPKGLIDKNSFGLDMGWQRIGDKP